MSDLIDITMSYEFNTYEPLWHDRNVMKSVSFANTQYILFSISKSYETFYKKLVLQFEFELTGCEV